MCYTVVTRFKERNSKMKQDKWLVLGANSYQAEVRDSKGAKRMKNKYQLNVGERVEWGYVDPSEFNIVAVARVDGSARFPARCNGVCCGEHLNSYGPRGGLRGVFAVVVRG